MYHQKLRLTIPWESIELSAQNQILRVLSVPELECLAVMPDVNPGYDLCIGGVALLRGIISPSFVGYDIGCGMCHVNVRENTSRLGLGRPRDREKFFARLQKTVPSGLGEGNGTIPVNFQSAGGEKTLNDMVNNTATRQLGSLGSGNHFLELGKNSRGDVGITIHSGSRRAGYDIADWYVRKAKGSFIELDCELGQAYLKDMTWATEFALKNRRLMLEATLTLLGFYETEIASYLASMINENHNHAVLKENGLVLHRKGAASAEQGQLGVISANQRDGVYVTKGLGNEEFLCSASHGAGRVITRGAASKKGSVELMQKMMKGIVCRTDKAVLDEAPWAYKRIDTVLAAQAGILIEVLDHFKPVIVLKGATDVIPDYVRTRPH